MDRPRIGYAEWDYTYHKNKSHFWQWKPGSHGTASSSK
jgi:uncharacterized C2H2 Zn-finger protein